MVACTHCGASLTGNGMFCAYCGAQVEVTVRVEISGELTVRIEERGTNNVVERSDFRIGVAQAK